LEERTSAVNGKPLSASDFAQQQKHPVLEMEMEGLASDAAAESSSPTANNPMSSLKSWMTSPFRRNANPSQQQNSSSVVHKAASFLKLGPLSRKEPSYSQSETAQEDGNDEEIQVVHSNNLLGDEELAALAQYKESKISLRALYKLSRKHPREAFIVFTFVMAVFVYLYSRRKSNEDDVTR
jgi:hypothetical protein